MAVETQPLILAVESATRAGSACLARGSEILASLSGDESLSHSTDLIENLDNLLASQKLTVGEVNLFAAASGPGSFTGLRIGLATVKSLAVCTRKQCVGISTLAAIAHSAGPSARTVATLPAGRGEVFAQMFVVDETEVRPFDAAAHIPPRALRQEYASFAELTIAGERDSLDQIARAGEGNWPPNWKIKESSGELAISIAALGLRELARGNVVSPEELRATYVRASDAELKQNGHY